MVGTIASAVVVVVAAILQMDGITTIMDGETMLTTDGIMATTVQVTAVKVTVDGVAVAIATVVAVVIADGITTTMATAGKEESLIMIIMDGAMEIVTAVKVTVDGIATAIAIVNPAKADGAAAANHQTTDGVTANQAKAIMNGTMEITAIVVVAAAATMVGAIATANPAKADGAVVANHQTMDGKVE